MKTAYLLTILICLLQMLACKTPPTLRGDALVNAEPTIRSNIKNDWDRRIDTSHVYTLYIVKCKECVHSLSVRRYKTPISCDFSSCTVKDETDSTGLNNLTFSKQSPAKFDTVGIHYLRFLDEKRVVYGVRKGNSLPEGLDLQDRFRRFAGSKKFARGYYYTINGNLYVRLQDRRNHKIYDWVFNIQGSGKDLKLNMVTAYNAQENDVNSAGFEKRFDLGHMLSYNFTFHRNETTSIPVKPKLPPCLGLPPKDCTTW